LGTDAAVELDGLSRTSSEGALGGQPSVAKPSNLKN
jgi:hypothetical protein